MTDPWCLKPPYAAQPTNKVAELAARQRGIVTFEEMRACGMTRHEIQTWLRKGQLHEKHRGVYAVGHRTLTTEARFLAATKACGADAALSRYAAIALWDLLEWDGRPIAVSATTRRTHPGLRIHRTTRLERAFHKGIPVTPPLRTLVDVSSMLPFNQLRRAARNAFNQRLVTSKDLATARSPALRRIAADLQPTANEFEDLVLDLIREAGFEEPLVNQRLGRYIPDFRWPHRNLIVEADGAQTHDHALARHDDARRTRELG